MTNHNEDSFRPKLKAPRSTRSVPPRFISRVIKAASQAGPVARGQVSPGRAREGGKLGRGFVQARLAHHRMSATSRRVTVKMRMVVLARAGRRSSETSQESQADSDLRGFGVWSFAELIYGEVGFCFYTVSANSSHSRYLSDRRKAAGGFECNNTGPRANWRRSLRMY